ncbi:MAG: hypothetical protein JNK02_16965 [Planctomycetes bacterium]|nr:hypothetical protein [Planctomycetota bacterium]
MPDRDAEPQAQDGTQSPQAPEASPGEDQVQQLCERFAEIAGLGTRLARLRAARWKLRAAWVVSAAFLGVIVALVAIAAGLAGVALVFRGLPATLTDLLGLRAGPADLLSGLILLGGIVSFVLAARAWSGRRILREYEERSGSQADTD